MSYAYREAYTEVYYILQNMSEADVSKIPMSVLEVIKRNRLRNYNVTIDTSLPLKDQGLKEETKAILSILYRKFLCDEDEREVLEKRFLEKLKEEIKLKSKIE